MNVNSVNIRDNLINCLNECATKKSSELVKQKNKLNELVTK